MTKLLGDRCHAVAMWYAPSYTDKHWFAECPYLHPETTAPGWIPNPQTQRHVQDALREPHMKRLVDKHLAGQQQSRQGGYRGQHQSRSHSRGTHRLTGN